MSYLQIAGLKISYGEKVVLHNIDLQVGKGEMIALLGPSGCGKTTLLNALCGFIPVQSGRLPLPIAILPTVRQSSAISPWYFKATRCGRI
jgi:ABC-type Fe3+/spermidine/putrescine transport system ATPase subunit